MSLFKNNKTVDTPFDNYKERQEERERLMVDHVPESPVYMTQEAVFFMVSIVMSLFQKTLSIGEGSLWTLVTFLVILIWSFTVRLFVPKRNMLLNVFINTLFVLLSNIGVVVLLGSFTTLGIVPTDTLVLMPLGIGFSILSYEFHSEDYFDYKEDLLWPSLRTLGLMIVVSALCDVLGIKVYFVSILLSSLLMLFMSRVISLINKREFLFAPLPAYSVFKSVPSKHPLSFVRYFSYRIYLVISMVVASIVTIIVQNISVSKGIDIKWFIGILVAVVMFIFLLIADFIPFFKSEFRSASKLARYIKYYEFPVLCVLLTYGISCGYSYIRLGVYVIVLVLIDILFTGFLISLPRRLLITRRCKYLSGAPAILMTLALLVMVVNILFMLY